MATIAENLQIIKDSTNAIKLAILDKGVEITGGITTYADSISKLPAKDNNVVFYDYDGTVLYSYTKDKFLALTSLPELPSQPGLICQEWNWTLEDAKTYVQEYGKLDIGATYITDDNKTRLYINLLNDVVSVPLYINQTASSGVTVDWGDGSSETVVGTGYKIFNHTYVIAGSYIISLTVNSGTCTLGYGNSSYSVMGPINTIASGSLYKVEIGSNMSIGNYAFQNCYSLQSVTIPNSLTNIDNYAFCYCYNLSSLVLPNSVNSIGSYAFDYCSSLQSVTIPNSVYSIGKNAFYYCYSLSSLVLPNSLTNIDNYAFCYCYSLQSVTIPNSVAFIGQYAFNGCHSLQSVTIPNSLESVWVSAFASCSSLSSITIPNSLTSVQNSAFYYCYSLQSVTIPNSVTSIGDTVFGNCYSLQSVTIPNSVTSIGNYAFQNCYSLQSVTIPNSVTSIGASTFSNCYSMQYYDFTACTSIPTLSNATVFGNIKTGCEIRVPVALYESWKSATNWSNYADYIVTG